MIKAGRFLSLAQVLAICVTILALAASAGADDGQGLRKYTLPQWETPCEQALTETYGQPAWRGLLTAPPVGTVLAPAEFGLQDGILVVFDSGWGHIYRPMIEEIQAAGAIAYIVVESVSEKNQVLNHLDSYGIPTDMVEFVIVNIDSVWIRDYGPFTILADGLAGIVDADYSRPWRTNDDLFPSRLAGPTMWDMDHYGLGMVLDGGNFMSDGCGTCMVTDEIFDWNPSMSETEITANLADYLGCERVVYLLHQLNDGTGHIDMFAKFLDTETILLAQFEPGDTNYQRIEDNAATLAALETCTGGSYDIIRIETEYGFRTYTNSQFVNDTILVPIWGLAYDATALAIYEAAMPGYDIVGINVASMAGTGGAIHCIARELPEVPEPDCADDDGDGYALEGGICGEIDCDDTDAGVNPGQEEIPDNGIDDNCDGEIDEGVSCFITVLI